MRILVDASAACDQTAGIGRYSRALLERIIPARRDDLWTLFRAPARRSPSLLDVRKLGHHSRIVTAPFDRRRADQLWFRARVPLDVRLLAGRADLVYSPDFTAPPAYGVPRLITVHDLAFLTHPALSTPALRRYLSNVVPRQVRTADRIAVVSAATRDELGRLLDVDEARIDVVPNGVDDRFFVSVEGLAAAKLRLDLPPRYMLMVGTIEPRKNHLGVLRALAQRPATIDVPLIVAGRIGWGADDIVTELARLERSGRVRMMNFVDEADLPLLYAGAEVVLYPSWTEGFGLPILEAFAAGRPIITGTAPALQEVGGDLATYVDPADDVAIGRAIEDALAANADSGMEDKRRAHAATFSWDASARALGDALDRCLVDRR